MTTNRLTTFLDLPASFNDPKTARYFILPLPYEGTVCFGKGTQEGPRRMIEVSDQMEYVDEETRLEFYRPGIVTCPAVPPQETPEKEMAAIRLAIRENRLFADGRFPIIFGGEHSVTPPIVEAAAAQYPNLSVLQFDAHSDLRDAYEPGAKFSHASAMRRVLEITPHLAQVGIRSFSEGDLAELPDRVDSFITPADIEDDFSAALAKILGLLTENVYVTIDMDAFDPAYAPGVGTPEPGGLSWRQITRILRRVFEEKNVIGADVVETAPVPGSFVTEFLAARLVSKLMVYDQVGRKAKA